MTLRIKAGKPEGSRTIPCADDPELMAKIPVRTGITVLSSDDPHARTIGCTIYETLGTHYYHPPAGYPKDFTLWTEEQKQACSVETLAEVTTLEGLTEGDLLLKFHPFGPLVASYVIDEPPSSFRQVYSAKHGWSQMYGNFD